MTYSNKTRVKKTCSTLYLAAYILSVGSTLIKDPSQQVEWTTYRKGTQMRIRRAVNRSSATKGSWRDKSDVGGWAEWISLEEDNRAGRMKIILEPQTTSSYLTQHRMSRRREEERSPR